MNISRSRAAEIARETAQITRDEFYTDAAGQRHDIADDIEKAVAKTRLYAPAWTPPQLGDPGLETRVEVSNETTLRAARRLFDAGHNAASLNFASATNVGGGWLNGARAQEEYLCRNSVLAQCIGEKREFYSYHREHRAPRYSDTMLYSPDVPIIRNEFDNLCAPWPCSVITAAAPNLNNGLAIPLQELGELWRKRIARVFDIALANGHDALILGAWGCGAFHNDPTMVARAFADVAEKYDGQFALLHFAVLDVGGKQGNFEPFQKQFQKYSRRDAERLKIIMPIEKIVIVTKKTPLEELIERYNTREQARFYIEHLGQNFARYETQHQTYKNACEQFKAELPRGVRAQWIERETLPMFGFGDGDVVVAIGPDGLVVNLAKYLRGQTVVAFNPDPRHIDGVLLPFRVADAPLVWKRLARGDLPIQNVTMARARTADGQQILAVNDLFLGASSHVSARYKIEYRGRSEAQISSGVIVSTGAGSTGWRRSIVCGAAKLCGENSDETDYRFAPDARQLAFCVREPFESLASGADIIAGEIQKNETLDLVSQMPQGGVIFGDGVTEDWIEWNAGIAVSVGVADETLRLARG